MPSRTVEPDFTDESGFRQEFNEPRYLSRPFDHQLGMET